MSSQESPPAEEEKEQPERYVAREIERQDDEPSDLKAYTGDAIEVLEGLDRILPIHGDHRVPSLGRPRDPFEGFVADLIPCLSFDSSHFEPLEAVTNLALPTTITDGPRPARIQSLTRRSETPIFRQNSLNEISSSRTFVLLPA